MTQEKAEATWKKYFFLYLERDTGPRGLNKIKIVSILYFFANFTLFYQFFPGFSN